MDIESRLGQLEKKIEELERQIRSMQSEKAQPAPMPVQTARPPASLPIQPDEPAPAPKAPIDWEHLIARVWLPKIFIVVFLIGVLWGFTAAVNAGIITEPVRCVIGLAAAIIMFCLGERQIAWQRNALGQVLLGGSVAVLILSLFAAHMLYALIPSVPAFVLYVLTIALGLFAAIRHRSQTLMIIALAAGYLVPFLVDSAEPDLRIFVAYESLFSISMILLAYRYAYRTTLYFAFGVLHVPLLIGYAFGGSDEYRDIFMLAVLLQHAALFILFTFRKEMNNADRSVILLSGFGLMALWGKSLYAGDSYVYPLLLAAWSLIYSAAAAACIRRRKPFEVYTAVATAGWFLWLFNALDAGSLAASIVAEGTIAVLLGMALKSKLQQIAGWFAFLIGAILVLVIPIESIVSEESLSWLVVMTAIAVFYWRFRTMPAESNYRTFQSGLVWIDAGLLFLFVSLETNIITESLGGDIRHLILSAVWIVYAISAILFGVAAQIRKARLAGILLMFVTLLKVIFVDLPDVSTAIRAVLFLGLGLIGVAVSRLFYKRKEKPEKGTQN